MSDAEQTTQFQMTKPAPIVWVHVVAPRPERKIKGGEIAPPSYETTFLLGDEHPDMVRLKQQLAAVAVGNEKIAAKVAANKAAGRPTFDGVSLPLETGTRIADEAAAKGKDREFLRGMVLAKAKSNVKKRDGSLLSPPRLVVLQDGKYVRYREDHERPLAKKFFYSGVLAIGTFAFNAWSSGMGCGVTAYLNEILSLNAGEPINTGVDDEARYGAPDSFKGYVGKVSSVDPTAGMANEITY